MDAANNHPDMYPSLIQAQAEGSTAMPSLPEPAQETRREPERFEEVEMPSLDPWKADKNGNFHCGLQKDPDDPESGICKKKYNTKRDLKKHLRTHYKPVLCPSCPFRAAEQKDVGRHVNIHHPGLARQRGSTQSRVRCEEPNCGQSFTRPDNLRKHETNVHGRRSS